MLSVEAQMDILCRGIVDLHVRSELVERLAEGRPLKVKTGFDPTRPDLHLGHTVLMQKMRQFQELGHTVIFIVGDFTAMVGDPTGQNDLRPRLSREDVAAAAATYQEQAFKILDRDTTVVRYNSEWLDKLNAGDLVELCAKYTVARMMERDDFAKRFAESRPIHIHEFLYPLMQAYDSVVLDCDIELGGTEQLFNLLVGRDLMPRYGKRAQMVMTTPLLEGTDARVVDGKIVGKKMSKSADNYVGINEPPFEMLQKLLLIDDLVIWRYMDLLSAKSNEEIAEIKADVAAGRTSVIAVKEAFAVEIVTRFHSSAAADTALARRRSVAKGGLPENIAEARVSAGDRQGLWIAKAMKETGLAPSTSEAVRLIKGGAVYVGEGALPDEALKRENMELERGKRYLIRVGSKNRKFQYIKVDD